jgi:hypothetical protein
MPEVLAHSPDSEVGTPSGKTLDELLTELSQVFGRFTKWRLYCKEQNATTEADLIRLAEQVLAGPCTGTVAEGYSYWLRLNGAQSISCPYPYTPTVFANQQHETQGQGGGAS